MVYLKKKTRNLPVGPIVHKEGAQIAKPLKEFAPLFLFAVGSKVRLPRSGYPTMDGKMLRRGEARMFIEELCCGQHLPGEAIAAKGYRKGRPPGPVREVRSHENTLVKEYEIDAVG